MSDQKKPGKHIIFLGAGASYNSGYPLADRLRLLMTSKRALRDWIFERFEKVPESIHPQISNGIVEQRKPFEKSLELFRRGGFATVDEFCSHATAEFRQEVNDAKTYMRLILMMTSPEWTFHKSEYYRFVQRLFGPDLKTPRDDVAVLTYNYDNYLCYLATRFYECRNLVASKTWDHCIPESLLGGLCSAGKKLTGQSGLAILNLHGVAGFLQSLEQGNQPKNEEMFDISHFFSEEQDFALPALKTNLSVPGPVVFPWEIFAEDGSFIPKDKCLWNFKTHWPTNGKQDYYDLFADVWTRARQEVQNASKVSFVGMTLHSYLLPGLRYLFTGKTGTLKTVIANPDMKNHLERSSTGRPILHPSTSAVQIRAALSDICKIGHSPGNVSDCAVENFSDFIDHEMVPG